MLTNAEVQLDGRFVSVSFDFDKGCPQTEDDPGQDDGYEIVSVEGIEAGRFTNDTLEALEKALKAMRGVA